MSATRHLRDFKLDRRVLMLSAVSLVIGAGGAGLAVVLSKQPAAASAVESVSPD